MAEAEKWQEKFEGRDIEYYEAQFKEWCAKQEVPVRSYKAAFFSWTARRIEKKIDDAEVV